MEMNRNVFILFFIFLSSVFVYGSNEKSLFLEDKEKVITYNAQIKGKYAKASSFVGFFYGGFSYSSNLFDRVERTLENQDIISNKNRLNELSKDYSEKHKQAYTIHLQKHPHFKDMGTSLMFDDVMKKLSLSDNMDTQFMEYQRFFHNSWNNSWNNLNNEILKNPRLTEEDRLTFKSCKTNAEKFTWLDKQRQKNNANLAKLFADLEL